MKTRLFNPGPTNVSEKVRKAIKTRDICHREKEFFRVLLRINKNIIKVLNGCGTHSAVLFVSSGTGCNEAICASIHGKVLVINNGKYSDRICDILERYKISMKVLKFEPFKPIDLDLIEQELENDKEITHIYLVHHETTTGALAPLRKIGELAEKYNKLFCVDSVSGLGGHEFNLQKDKIDFCSVSANKCLESFPGVSFVIGRTKEIGKLEGKSRSFYFDIYSQWKKEQKGETPFTPAVQLVFALDTALEEFIKEGYEQRIERYKGLATRMRDGLQELGFELLLLPAGMQSNILTAIKMPEKMDYWKVHDKLKQRGITIYSGKEVLEQRKFRVATLGHINNEDVDWFLKNLREVMEPFDPAQGLREAEKKGWDLLWEKKGENIKEFDPVKLGGFDNNTGEFNEDFVNVVASEIKSKLELSKEDELLDVGCGAGMLLIPLSKYVKSVSGVDLSSSLINQFRKNFKEANLFVSGADKLPFQKDSFNKIFVHSVFQYFPSLQYARQSILEMIRVCRKGGRILIMDIPDSAKKELSDAYRAKLGPGRTSDPSLNHRFYEKEFFKEICEKNNLKYEIWNQDIKGYKNSEFRFNILIKL